LVLRSGGAVELLAELRALNLDVVLMDRLPAAGPGPALVGPRVARQRVELDTGRAFINQTWTFYADDFDDACQFGDGIIHLPMSPLSTVTTLKYYNTSNVLTTWSATEYQVNTGHEPGRITTVTGYSYPSTYDRLGAVEIAYVAGYGGAGEGTCPRAMYDAMYLMIGHLYENREAVVTGTIMTTAPIGYHACCAMAAVGWCF
jgi:uncharacterized phiE125 gp8 family phage protein